MNAFVPFERGQTFFCFSRKALRTTRTTVNGGLIPPHNTVGAVHFAFAVASDELDSWRQLLAREGIQIESEVTWDRGGNSIYFRDPDGNLLELVTPGVWANY
jgi:catechol 2,3-dioxygenase-like lactoylglutathione lyase family enzyme